MDLEDYVARPDRISGADINAICQEAGMHAVRENRCLEPFSSALGDDLNECFHINAIITLHVGVIPSFVSHQVYRAA